MIDLNSVYFHSLNHFYKKTFSHCAEVQLDVLRNIFLSKAIKSINQLANVPLELKYYLNGKEKSQFLEKRYVGSGPDNGYNYISICYRMDQDFEEKHLSRAFDEKKEAYLKWRANTRFDDEILTPAFYRFVESIDNITEAYGCYSTKVMPSISLLLDMTGTGIECFRDPEKQCYEHYYECNNKRYLMREKGVSGELQVEKEISSDRIVGIGVNFVIESYLKGFDCTPRLYDADEGTPLKSIRLFAFDEKGNFFKSGNSNFFNMYMNECEKIINGLKEILAELGLDIPLVSISTGEILFQPSFLKDDNRTKDLQLSS